MAAESFKQLCDRYDIPVEKRAIYQRLWDAAIKFIEAQSPAPNTGSPKLPLYSKVMEDIFGKDWAVNSRIISADAEHKCHRVYNYIARQLRAGA